MSILRWKYNLIDNCFKAYDTIFCFVSCFLTEPKATHPSSKPLEPYPPSSVMNKWLKFRVMQYEDYEHHIP